MAKNWVAGAVKNKGGLHKALGVPVNQTIPKKKLDKAAAGGGVNAKRARLAKTLMSFNKK